MPGTVRSRSTFATAVLAMLALGAAAGWRWEDARRRSATSLAAVELLLEAGRHAEAQAVLAAKLRRDPHDNHAWLLEGHLRNALGDRPGAAAAYARVGDDSAHALAARAAQAQAALARHDAAAAAPALLATLARADAPGPQWRAAVAALAGLWRAQDKSLELQSLQRELLQRAPAQRRGAVADALAELDLSRMPGKERLPILQRLHAGNPQDLETLGALGLALIEAEQHEAALELLRPALGAAAPQAVWHGWIYGLYRAQRFEDLSAALAAAPAEVRVHPWYLRARATALSRAGDHAAALASILQAVAVNDTVVAVNREAAALARRAGRPDLAAAAEQRAEVWHQREVELRDANRLMAEAGARRPFSPAVAAVAARRVAAANQAMNRDELAERSRRLARTFEDAARRVGAPAAP